MHEVEAKLGKNEVARPPSRGHIDISNSRRALFPLFNVVLPLPYC